MADSYSNAPASDRTVAAVLELLRAARDHTVVITRTKVAKLLYLADLDAVSDGDDPISGIEWRWLHYGPYENSLRHLEGWLVEQRRVVTEPYFDGVQLQLAPGYEPSFDLPAEDRELIERTVARLGDKASTSLRDLTYLTAPMVAAQEAGQRDVVLDLGLARPVPTFNAARRMMRAKLAEIGPATTDSGAFDELREDLAALAPARQRANATLLGDD